MSGRIKTTYTVYTEKASLFGLAEDQGWENEEGEVVETIEEAVKVLRANGAVECDGPTAYSQTDPSCDRAYFERGEDKRLTFHLEGFTDEELLLIRAGVAQ